MNAVEAGTGAWVAATVAAGFVLWRAAGGLRWRELLSAREQIRPPDWLRWCGFRGMRARPGGRAGSFADPRRGGRGRVRLRRLAGSALTWLDVAFGGTLGFLIPRLFGREYATRNDRLGGPGRQPEEHGTLVFSLRLVPRFSSDALSYAAGLSGVSFRGYWLATALGTAPGSSVRLGGASSSEPDLYAAFRGLAILAVAACPYYRRQTRIARSGR